MEKIFEANKDKSIAELVDLFIESEPDLTKEAARKSAYRMKEDIKGNAKEV